MKIITPLFVFALVYSFLSMLFGPKGFFALQQLKRQREAVVNNVQLLSDIGEKLTTRIANLSSDPETIAIYARDLGYVHKGEGLIKLMGFSDTVEKNETAGTAYSIQAPRFLSDNLCKAIAGLVSLIVVLCELIIGQKNAYSKERTALREANCF